MSETMRRGAALAWAAVLALALLAGGCGVKGPPRPPDRPIIKGL